VVEKCADLNIDTIPPNNDNFILWLEQAILDHLFDAPVESLQSFISNPQLVDDLIAKAIALRVQKN